MCEGEPMTTRGEESAREAERAALRARIQRLERLILSGEATLDDYGALAIAQLEWERAQNS